MIRYDTITLIVTVGARKNSYRLLTTTGYQDKKLKLNEFAYRLKIQTNEEEWKQRIQDLGLPVIRPPEAPILSLKDKRISPDLPTQVLERMSDGQ